jgi:hypothetical protein
MTDHTCGLFATTGSASFCGPTALAAITGATPEAVEQLIVTHRATHGLPRHGNGRQVRDVRRGAIVRTMWGSEVAPIAEALGWRATLVEHGCYRPRTFAQWRRRGRARGDDAPYLVLITGHFVAVRGPWFVDTTYRTPTLAASYRRQRKRVVRVWRLEPLGT